jgi:hydrogenase maturation protease
MSTTRVSPRLLVCGNVDRRDDGAAIWAVSGLIHALHAERRVEVRRCGQLDIEDLLDGAGRPLVIADAAVGAPPGSIVTVAFDDLVETRSTSTPHSSHALPIAQVLGIARQLADEPIDGVFVGVGGVDFGFGRGLSAEVRAALPGFRSAIAAALLQSVPLGVAELRG